MQFALLTTPGFRSVEYVLKPLNFVKYRKMTLCWNEDNKLYMNNLTLKQIVSSSVI